MTINIFQRRRAIAEVVTQKGHQTLNQIAQALGISQTSVWRHQTARQALADTPVAEFWSSAAGMVYLIRVVVAVFYCFGIKHGVGTESLSEFFRMIDLDKHLATSPSALRTFKVELIELIGQYGIEPLAALDVPQDKEVIVGAEATFFDSPILVFMELASGYIFFEMANSMNSFESWSEECNGIELTIIHNFDTRRADDSTPAERLFEQSFPCLFEWVVGQVTELPPPRKSKKS